MMKVVKKIKNGLRWILIMECGHTADAVHPDDYVRCITCMKVSK